MAVASAFDTLTESYLAERFGGHPPTRDDEALAALRSALRAGDRPDHPRADSGGRPEQPS
jgi:hypothetical protein